MGFSELSAPPTADLLSEFAERRKFYTEYVAFGKVFGIRWNTYVFHLPPLSTSPLSRAACSRSHVCASAAERNWSVYGAIKTTARGQMGHAVAPTSASTATRRSTSRASFRPPATSRRSRSGTPTPTRTARTRRTSRCEASAAAAGAVWGGGRRGRCCEHVGRHARDLLTVRAAHARARLARARARTVL